MKVISAPFASCVALLRPAMCAVLLAIGVDGMAQGFVHRFPITTNPVGQGNALAMPDGGLMVNYRRWPEWALVRYAPDGNPLWSRWYGSDTEIGVAGLALMPDGSAVLSGSVDWMSLTGELRRYSNVRIGADGNLVWGKRYLLSGWPMGQQMAYLSGGVGISTDAESSLFTVLEHAGEGNTGPTLLKADATGELLWAVDVMEGPYAGSIGDLMPDGEGGCYMVVRRGGGLGAELLIHRFSANGALLWRTAFRSLSQFPWVNAGACVDGSGDLVMAGWMDSGAYRLRISADGTLLDARGYALAPLEYNMPFGLPVVRLPNGNLRLGERQVLTFNQEGDLLSNQWCANDNDTIGDEIHSLNHHISGADANGVTLVGYPWIANPAAQVFQGGYLAGRIPWHAIGEGCVFECQELPIVQSTPLSNEIFTYGEDILDALFEVTTSTVDLVVSSSEVAVPTTTRECLDLGLVGFSNPVAEAYAYPNPVRRDELLNVRVGRAVSFVVLDALGRSVQPALRYTVDGIQVETGSLAPGVYESLIGTSNTAVVRARFVVL